MVVTVCESHHICNCLALKMMAMEAELVRLTLERDRWRVAAETGTLHSRRQVRRHGAGSAPHGGKRRKAVA